MEDGGLRSSGFPQGGGDGGIEILLGSRFAAFNMLVRMQLGSIPTAACSLKQYLYLNNVDKLNVIFNVWYEYIWQTLVWAAEVLTDWKWRYLGAPPVPALTAELCEVKSSVFLALICRILRSSAMVLLWKLSDKISIHPSFYIENKTK